MRARDAATLIIMRNQREVLLGLRSAAHIFMPQVYVFPGGRVDSGDGRVPSPFQLRADVISRLTRSCSPARARSIAMAAVRETFEETGLIVGHRRDTNLRSRSPHWSPFFDTGYVPALDRLDYVARAITPPGQVRRYDARFFLVDAQHLDGELNGNGELEDLQWIDLDKVSSLKLSPITAWVLSLLDQRLRGAEPGDDLIPCIHAQQGVDRVRYE